MNNKVYIIAGIACLISMAYGINQKFYNNKLEFLLETYKAETTIQSAQFLDLTNNINLMKGFEYQRGFEDGKTQMGFAFVNGNSMHGYEDGYHSAIGQFDGDSFEAGKLKEKVIKDLHVRELADKLEELSSSQE